MMIPAEAGCSRKLTEILSVDCVPGKGWIPSRLWPVIVPALCHRGQGIHEGLCLCC